MSEHDLPKVADRLRVLRENEAAAILNIHVQTLRRWRRAGTGPAHIHLGVAMYGYRLGDLEAWQEAQRPAA